MADYYNFPAVPPGEPVHNLVPDAGKGNLLTPDSPVHVINRAPVAIRDTYDGVHYTIPPGWNLIAYGAAMHFRRRSVIPGSRNPETGKQDRYIVIPNHPDPPERCTPIAQVDYVTQSARPEAIDRSTLSSPAARNVKVIESHAEMARLAGAGASLGSSVRPNIGLEGNHEGSEAPAGMLTPDNTAVREQAADVASAAADGFTVDPVQPATRRRR